MYAVTIATGTPQPADAGNLPPQVADTSGADGVPAWPSGSSGGKRQTGPGSASASAGCRRLGADLHGRRRLPLASPPPPTLRCAADTAGGASANLAGADLVGPGALRRLRPWCSQQSRCRRWSPGSRARDGIRHHRPPIMNHMRRLPMFSERRYIVQPAPEPCGAGCRHPAVASTSPGASLPSSASVGLVSVGGGVFIGDGAGARHRATDRRLVVVVVLRATVSGVFHALLDQDRRRRRA